MRLLYSVLFLIAILISTSCNNAVSDKSETVTESRSIDNSTPVLKPVAKDTAAFTNIKWIDSTFKDLGVIKYKDSAIITYRFKNIGNQPLIVQSVKTTCGCTVADTLYKPVMPGKESRLQLKFYSIGQAAAVHEKHIYVVTNTKPYQGTTLAFKVEVKD